MIPYRMNPLGISISENLPLTLTAEQANSSVTLNATGSPTVSGLQYRTGTSGLWLPYTIGDTITLANIGDSVQFWNRAYTLSLSTSDYVQFAMTGQVAGSGNIQSLLNWRSDVPAYSFCNLFRSCPIIAPPELPSMQLGNYCYVWMFINSDLSVAPALPAVIPAEGCYYAMLIGTKIISCTIKLASLSAYSLHWMFRGVYSLRSLEVNFTEWVTNGSNGWVYGVFTSGTFTKPTALPQEYGDNQIPTGWTVVNK